MEGPVKKKMLIVSTSGMEIGGIERSIIGLLNAIDYNAYDVDLFLFSHAGPFFSLINPKANLLKQNKHCALIRESIVSELKHGCFFLAFVRLYSKVLCKLRSKLGLCGNHAMTMAFRLINPRIPKLKKHYDIALGFFEPHDFLIHNVDADVKVGWIHTDYVATHYNVAYAAPNLKKLDYIAAVSDECGVAFQSLMPEMADKLITIENILDSRFVQQQAEAFVSDEIDKTDNAITVCSVGRFCEAKGFDEAVVACSILVDRGYAVRWYLIGYGPDEDLIRRTIREYHMEKYVIILGKKENPYPYMKACDIYAQPSRYEGKAVTVREAQILGKPVIITRYATSASQVEEGIDGYICEMGIDGIVAGMEFLINHPEVRHQLAANTKQRQYDNTSEVEKIYRLFGK